MTAFLWRMRVLSLLGFSGLLLICAYFSPYSDFALGEKNLTSIFLFYLALLMAGTGALALMLFRLRQKACNEELTRRQMIVSLRQGIILSLMLVVILVIQSFRVLVWWDGLLAVGAVMMVELYFLVR